MERSKYYPYKYSAEADTEEKPSRIHRRQACHQRMASGAFTSGLFPSTEPEHPIPYLIKALSDYMKGPYYYQTIIDDREILYEELLEAQQKLAEAEALLQQYREREETP